MDYIIEMLNITKEFPGVIANDNINLQVKKQEIHALLGENGAGKSTLMSILFGLYQQDKGIIKIHGKDVNINNPNIANELGIGMVHQHFKLVHNFTVTENIILGMEPTNFLKIDMKEATRRVQKISKQYGLNVDPYAVVEEISVGMQQRVEILKMLYRNSEILIFDEPTAVLTPQEIKDLMIIMKKLIIEGKTIILITHKLKEIKEVADRCTILRKGKYVSTINVNETSEEEMARQMVGREVFFTTNKGKKQVGKDVLQINNIKVKNDKGLDAVKKLSLSVKSGEILGLAGIDGNGQTELIEAITGLRKIEEGSINFLNKRIDKLNIRKRIEAGIGHIPEDRHKHGLVLDYTLEENEILHLYYKEPFSKHGIINKKQITKYSDKLIKDFDVRSSQGSKTIVRSMSGGNQQKAIIAREVTRSPQLLIAAQPTRGLDVGAIEFIHKRLIEERNKGKAILLISLELDEILNLSDRIAIIYEGKIIDIVDADKTNENEIGYMMAGFKKEGKLYV